MNARISAALVVVVGLVSALLLGTQTRAAASTGAPVVVVHGYGCQDTAQVLGGVVTELSRTGTAPGDIHLVDYYGCATGGESIVGLGPLNGPACSDRTAYAGCPAELRSPDKDGTNTSIVRFSYELAWYLHDKFGGTRPVALVGASMGGLVVTYALQQIAAHNPIFPDALQVPTVVTVATPFAGATLCSNNTECLQMRPTGRYSLIPGVLAAGAVQIGAPGQTDWVAEGSNGCDLFPGRVTTALPHLTTRLIYTFPCYTHAGYVADPLSIANAKGTLNGLAYSNGLHALDFMQRAIDAAS